MILSISTQIVFSQNGETSKPFTYKEALAKCDVYNSKLEKKIEDLRLELKLCDISDSTKKEYIKYQIQTIEELKKSNFVLQENLNKKDEVILNLTKDKFKNKILLTSLGVVIGVLLGKLI